MFKRCFTAHLIGNCKQQQHRIALICLLIFTLCSQNVHSQQQIAQDAYAILEQNCFNCHGPEGSYRDTLFIEYNALTENGTVVPGNPNASELYKRLVTTETAKRMPLGGQLSAQAISTIQNWIAAGAPDWAATATTNANFISPGDVLNTIETHLTSLSSFDRTFARYFTMTHLYNAGESPQILEEYHKALSKLVNSLSWGATVINPEPIDSQGTIFYIDLRHYEWDRNDAWTQIEAVYPYHISFDAPAQTALKEQLKQLQGEMQSDIPSVHADWFIATASLPPLYHDLLSLPSTDRELETRLEVDVDHNLQNAPGVRVWRAGTNNSRVSANNRVLERHLSRYGAYWKSYDFAGSVGAQNIFTHPLNFTHDGGEVIFNLPNGLQGYYIANASGSRLDAAPISIVSNPAASDPTVRTGLSCFGCHIEGMNTFEDQVRAVIDSTTNPTYDKAQALRLYVEKSEMDALVQEDIDTYRQALEETGGAFDDIEPISRFHEVFQDEVDAAYAAAVIGLETEAFLERIRENIGLQNIGLLVLDSENGSVKRDVWTSSFEDIVFALDFPENFTPPPVITPPITPPGAVVDIPDPGLRTAIAEALGKSLSAPITVEEMEQLGKLDAKNRDIRDLTGLQFAIKLNELFLNNNQISDLSPIAGLINLSVLDLWNTPVSNLSPLTGLKNLSNLIFGVTSVSDLSPLIGLVNLERLHFYGAPVSDLSPLAGLINLKYIAFSSKSISDLSPLAKLINLENINTWGSPISNLSPLAELTALEFITIGGAEISDLTPLMNLTGLRGLHLAANNISDISPLAGLTRLNRLELSGNNISDISPLAGLINLKWLAIDNNQISDLSPLNGLSENIKLLWHSNPGFPKGGPKIEGPWLWVVLSDTGLEIDTDLLSEASGGTVTEVEIATHGVIEGQSVGQEAWTSYRLPPTGKDNIADMLQQSIDDGVIYGSVSLYSPREQETTMYVGSDDRIKVWFNGSLVHQESHWRGAPEDYTDFFPVTLKQGSNVLLVAVRTHGNGFFGFEPGTEYTVLTPSIGYTFSKTPIHAGDTFTLDISAETVFDLAGWQFDIAFDPAALEAISVSEGDFLKMGGGSTFFQSGTIDNASGKITGLSAARLSNQGVNGTGTILQVTFRARSPGETELALQNFQFGSATGDTIPAGPREIRVVIEEGLATGDVNRDGVVSILDLILVAQQLGRRVSVGSAVDVNGDGIVSILDLIRVAQGIAGSPAAPVALNPDRIGAVGTESVDAATIQAWIAQAQLEDDGSLAFKEGIKNLQKLLASMIPQETALLPNYPNPFNPETWIPYQLAEPAEVTLTIYDMNGQLVRRLTVGHQAAGIYQSRTRAVYWDGRNQLGESVASGLYLYTLTAKDFTATRKMLILK